MKKSERVNDMLVYLNDKKSFNLKDIMEKYKVSRSTALRDIQSLEGMGMPIYSKSGRNGYYGILANRLLSPIIFNIDEVYALYFSMETLKAYQSTPFHLSIERLKKKFESCISQERIEDLRKMEQVFKLNTYESESTCDFLRDILDMALGERVCRILYLKGNTDKIYYVQFFNITSSYGQWYATAYNFKTQRPQVFRCDKIKSLELCDKYTPKPVSDFLISAEEMFGNENSTGFEVRVSAKGADIFHKEHYPSMKLYCEDGSYYIKGFYNKGEELFIGNYFASYGESILSVKPDELKSHIVKRLDFIRSHFLERI